LVQFVKPHIFGTHSNFERQFAEPIGLSLSNDASNMDIKRGKARMAVLHNQLEPFMHRRTSHLLQRQLPPKHEIVLYVKQSPAQATLYRLYLEVMSKPSKKATAITAFQNLKSIWSHPFCAKFNADKSERKKKSSDEKEARAEGKTTGTALSADEEDRNHLLAFVAREEARCRNMIAQMSEEQHSAMRNDIEAKVAAELQKQTSEGDQGDSAAGGGGDSNTTRFRVLAWLLYSAKAFGIAANSWDDLERRLLRTLASQNRRLKDLLAVQHEEPLKNNAVHTTSSNWAVDSSSSSSSSSSLSSSLSASSSSSSSPPPISEPATEISRAPDSKADDATDEVDESWCGVLKVLANDPDNRDIFHTTEGVSGKVSLCVAMIMAAKQNNDKTLVFCSSLPFLDVLQHLLHRAGCMQQNVARLQGDMPAKDKEKAIQKFQTNKKCFAFLLSLKAANVGINLTKATRVILVDQSWNPADDLQVNRTPYLRSFKIENKYKCCPIALPAADL
jgi:SNF2 family DNA or RNA helicase